MTHVCMLHFTRHYTNTLQEIMIRLMRCNLLWYTYVKIVKVQLDWTKLLRK